MADAMLSQVASSGMMSRTQDRGLKRRKRLQTVIQMFWMPAWNRLSSQHRILSRTDYNIYYVWHMMMTTEYSAIQASRTPETDAAVIFGFYTGSGRTESRSKQIRCGGTSQARLTSARTASYSLSDTSVSAKMSGSTSSYTRAMWV